MGNGSRYPPNGNGGGKTDVGQMMFRIVVGACLIGIFAIQVVSISGGGASSNIMARAESMLKRYPTEQFETTVHQAVKTIENMHKFSARADQLVTHLDTKKVDELIASARNIETSLKNLHEIKLKVN